MSITIVPMASDYIESYRDALGSVAGERRFIRMTEAPPLDEVEAYVCANLAAGNPSFVALSGEVVIGWCDITRSLGETTRHRGVLGISIVAGYRGAGIGRALIRRTLAAARERDFPRIELAVYANNEPAIQLYESVGFVREGHLKDAMRIDGKSFDLFTMAIVETALKAAA